MADAGDLEESCSNCGAEDWQVEEFGPVERLLRWLQFGRPVLRARMTCRNCGAEFLTHRKGSWRGYRRRRVLEGWWGAPIRVLWVLIHARTAIPAPWIYGAAAGAGALLGVALERTLEWPWWAVALASVSAVWGLFLLTAFKAVGRRMPQSLWRDLLDALDPKGAGARTMRREEEAFRNAPFPLYGLPPFWAGPRSLGGMGWGGMGKDAGLTELELRHGDPEDPEGTELRISSSVSRGERDLPWALVLRGLAEDLWVEGHPPPSDHEQLRQWINAREREHRRQETPSFAPVRIPVDDESVSFDHLADGSAWVAVTRRDALAITLRARNLSIEGVELVTVRDVEPYIEGSRQLHERWRNGHE
jgi:hypothetical protein